MVSQELIEGFLVKWVEKSPTTLRLPGNMPHFIKAVAVRILSGLLECCVMCSHSWSPPLAQFLPTNRVLGGCMKQQLPESSPKVSDKEQNARPLGHVLSPTQARVKLEFAAVAKKSTGRPCAWFSGSLNYRPLDYLKRKKKVTALWFQQSY